jgi:hypothetical protein
MDTVNDLLKKESVLGGEQIEGIAIKNYKQFHNVPWMFGHPIFAKFVQEKFKERNATAWKAETQTGLIEQLIAEYKSENRWLKAIQHLKEQNLLTDSPKDIGNIIKEILRDIEEEEKENIKEALWKHFWDRRLRMGVIHGFPMWYKEKLAKESL